MKVRKLLVMVVVLTLVFGTAAFAESITQSIKVEFNRKDVADGGLLVDNKTYMSVGALSRALQALVSWDNDAKKASIYKPNVHLLTISPKTNEAFNVVNAGRNRFLVFAQIDSLYTDITGLKITIVDPYKEETLIHSRTLSDPDFPVKEGSKTSTMSEFNTSTEAEFNFKYKGQYTLRYYMQISGESAMQVVSEKAIFSK